jgi:putative SOS response-associated peptidase YedK
MCGRYAFFSPAEAVKRIFALDDVPALEPRYNIAPTQDVAAVRTGEEGARAFSMLHWGLVPKWAKERAIGNRMINARSETLAEKPSFRDAFRKRRCLVLADGWYEWQVAAGGKQPWFIRRKDARPFAFAGLWERWQDPAAGTTLESCTIVTTDAAESIRKIHERMPVVLEETDWDRWTDTAFSDTGMLSELLKPFDPQALEAWPVSRAVNAPKNQGPGLIAAAD